MSTIVLDDLSGATPIRDIVNQAKDDVIELREPSGELIGMLTLKRTASPDDYAKLIASAEADIEELRRRARSTEPGLTTAELLSNLLTLTLREKN